MGRYLDLEDEKYLQKRGYTAPLLAQDSPFSVKAGNQLLDEGISFFARKNCIAWTCRTMSGKLAGIHTSCPTVKDYNWYATPGSPFLPIMYGHSTDYQVLYDTHEMVLCEGIFDRVALKQILPGKAVFARLSKGASGQLTHLVRRYAKFVWLAFDNDEAGIEGAVKAEKRVAQDVKFAVLKFPKKDPAEMLQVYGLEKSRALIERQIILLNF